MYMDGYRALSLSDFDFEMVLRDHDLDESSVLRMIGLEHFGLVVADGAFESQYRVDATHGLLSMSWNSLEQSIFLRTYLQQEIDSLASSHPLHGATVDRVVLQNADPNPPKGYITQHGASTPSARSNVVIFKCGTETCVLPAAQYFRDLGVRGVPCQVGAHLYLFFNTFGRGEQPVRKGHQPGLFHLSRIKHGFVMYYTTARGDKHFTRLGGEILDLSQSHGVRGDLKRRDLYRQVPRPYQRYPILGVDTRDATLYSYSIHGFLSDLKNQVHNTLEEPWKSKNPKMSKRMLGTLPSSWHTL